MSVFCTASLRCTSDNFSSSGGILFQFAISGGTSSRHVVDQTAIYGLLAHHGPLLPHSPPWPGPGTWSPYKFHAALLDQYQSQTAPPDARPDLWADSTAKHVGDRHACSPSSRRIFDSCSALDVSMHVSVNPLENLGEKDGRKPNCSRFCASTFSRLLAGDG